MQTQTQGHSPGGGDGVGGVGVGGVGVGGVGFVGGGEVIGPPTPPSSQFPQFLSSQNSSFKIISSRCENLWPPGQSLINFTIKIFKKYII